ncbi:MAG: LysM peptidoglycan-binding domain-containing protein [Kofleriaceae bacterium]|nr:LysM peptidoglycan-binding domain-containing protein [Kofleriaceae bacterium]
MIDPSGAAPPAQPAAVRGSSAPDSGGNVGGGEGDLAGVDYFSDYLDGNEFGDNRVPFRGGAVPYTHTVRSGDTLWDVSAYYFNDAWRWPKVWGLNPEITNPHWIYPGNILRLRDGRGVVTSPLQQNPNRRKASRPQGKTIGLRQVAYVDLKELEDSGRITGSVDDKALLSEGDSIYISYPKDDLPTIGQRFAVYRTRKDIRRDGKSIGAYVEVTGEIEIVKLAKDKRARAVVTRSVLVMERGMYVGSLQLNFDDQDPVINKAKVDGHIVGLIGPDQLIGASAAIIVDRGRKDGVALGNRFLVVRRGDAYRRDLAAGDNVGLNDDRYPARAIGEITIIQTGESASMGVVTFSTKEFGVGDRVYMRKGK